jgi:hypothetical protein
MNHLFHTFIVCITTALALPPASAADTEALLARPGKLLFEDDFSHSEMAPKWTTGKGSYLVEDGVAKLVEDRSAVLAALPKP